MVETVGAQLRNARSRHHLSIEDAAHATKIRASRLADLENDVYTNFPNIAYARGFLAIYGRYLGVDVRPYLGRLEDADSFCLNDYQYLSEQPVTQFRVIHDQDGIFKRKKKRTVNWPGPGKLVPALLAVATLFVAAVFWYLTISFQRLGSLDQLAERTAGGAPGAVAGAPATPAATVPGGAEGGSGEPRPAAAGSAAIAGEAATESVAHEPEEPVVPVSNWTLAETARKEHPLTLENLSRLGGATVATPRPAAVPAGASAPSAAPVAAASVPAAAPTTPAILSPPSPKLAATALATTTRVLPLPLPTPLAAPVSPPVVPVPAPAAALAAASRPPTPVPAPTPLKQVTVRPLRKTHLTVMLNDPRTSPVYEDWVRPGNRPLNFRATRFYMHVQDRNSVEISKDGIVQPQRGTDIAIE